jgi:hypothetical protein
MQEVVTAIFELEFSSRFAKAIGATHEALFFLLPPLAASRNR